MNLYELGEKLELDISSAVNRFGGNEGLYIRFLKKLCEDKNKSLLKQAVEEKDWKLAETSAHTLKGVAANLGLTKLSRLSDEIVQAVRGGMYSRIEEKYAELDTHYEEIMEDLKQLK